MTMKEVAEDLAESRTAEEWMEEWLRCAGDNARLEDKIKILVEALQEIAYGAPWGGPASDHVRFMRDVADAALTKTGLEDS